MYVYKCMCMYTYIILSTYDLLNELVNVIIETEKSQYVQGESN